MNKKPFIFRTDFKGLSVLKVLMADKFALCCDMLVILILQKKNLIMIKQYFFFKIINY